MARQQRPRLAFRIDKLTRSIQNVVTGDSLPTVVLPFTEEDLRTVTKKNGWQFNWRSEFRQAGRTVHKLTIAGNPDVVQGLVSFEAETNFVVMHLVESAPFNLGRNKMYAGVLGNLVAFGCKRSFELGHAGNLAFTAKTRLIEHYMKELRAMHVGHGRMIVDTAAAQYLVGKYFPA